MGNTNDRVTTREFYQAQMDTNDKIEKTNQRISDYHGEVKVLIAEVVTIKEDVKNVEEDVDDLRFSDKKWGIFAGIIGVISGTIAAIFGPK